MRVLCRNGHFAFYPQRSTELFFFCSAFNLTLVRDRDFYTFSAIAGAPRYSLKGKSYLGVVPDFSVEGEGPWEVFRENGFVYSLATSTLVKKSTISVNITPLFDGQVYIGETPLIQPGSKNTLGRVVDSYDAVYDTALNVLKVMEFEYE